VEGGRTSPPSKTGKKSDLGIEAAARIGVEVGIAEEEAGTAADIVVGAEEEAGIVVGTGPGLGVVAEGVAERVVAGAAIPYCILKHVEWEVAGEQRVQLRQRGP
jgi:hypothetical protein